MGRAARLVGIAVFAGVELLVLFGSYAVASVGCCVAGARAWPGGPAEWVALAIFAVVMIIPAGLIGLGAALATHGIAQGIATLRRTTRPGRDAP